MGARGRHSGRAQVQATHFAPSVVDLLIAASADHHGLTVLHYDADFDTITAATGISSEWVAEPGTADLPDEDSD